LAEARLSWTTRLDELEKAAEAGAPNFTQGVMGEFDAFKEKALDNAPDSVREQYAAALTELQSSIAGRAMAFEARERGAKVVGDAKAVFQANQNVALTDPSQLPALLQSTTATIDGLKALVPPSVAESLHNEAVGDLYHSAYAGEFDRAVTSPNPLNALAALKRKMAEPETGLRLRPADMERLSGQISAAEVRIRRQAEADAAADVRQATSLLLAGVPAKAPAGLGMVDAETRASYVSAQRAFNEARNVWVNSPRQNAELLAGIDRAEEHAASNDQLADLQVRRNAILASIQRAGAELKRDPAAYAASRVPEVAAAARAYARTAQELGPTPDQAGLARLASARQTYLAASANAQTHLGLAPTEIHPLRDDEVRAIGGQLQKINSTLGAGADWGKAGEQAQAILHRVLSEAGPYAPNVVQQLRAAKVLTEADGVAALMGAAPQALDLLQAGRRDRKEIERAAGGPQEMKSLESSASQRLDPLARALRAQGNYQLADNLGSATALLAAHYKSQGMSSADAVARASEYWDNRFQVGTYNGGSYFFPNNYDPGQIAGAVDRYVREVLPAKDLMVPPGFRTADPEAWKKQHANHVRAFVVPVTNPDGSGVTFRYATYGTPVVRDAQGRPITVTWDALSQMPAQERRGKLPRNQNVIPGFGDAPPGQN